MRKLRGDGGFILAFALMTALVASIFAYTILALSVSQGRQARFFRGRTPARYLAEAGMAIAYSQLGVNPAYCGGTEMVDTNGDSIGDAPVTVVVTNCGAGNTHQIQVLVPN